MAAASACRLVNRTVAWIDPRRRLYRGLARDLDWLAYKLGPTVIEREPAQYETIAAPSPTEGLPSRRGNGRRGAGKELRAIGKLFGKDYGVQLSLSVVQNAADQRLRSARATNHSGADGPRRARSGLPQLNEHAEGAAR